MQRLVLNPSSIFHLQKLAHDVRSTTGIRHKLADENSMMKLLKKATISDNSAVQRDLKAFANELNEEQINSLLSRGVILRQSANL